MISKILEFTKEIDRLKFVERQTLNHGGGRRENSAEHSWHLAMSVLAFQPLSAEPINLEKALTLALIHDLVEIDAGDTFVYGDQTNKYEKESAAIERLCKLLPEMTGQKLKGAWFEFEERSSAEARFVATLDKFLPLYANYLNGGYSWKNHNVQESQVRRNIEALAKTSLPALWIEAEKMISKSTAAGILGKN